jgi:hypothetical protein
VRYLACDILIHLIKDSAVSEANLQPDWPRQRHFAINTYAYGCVVRAGVFPTSVRTGSLEPPYGSATGYEESLGVD